MVSGILSGDQRMLLMPYGERWRGIRKHLHQILNTRSKNPYKAVQELESTQLLHEYLESPDRWFESNERLVIEHLDRIVLRLSERSHVSIERCRILKEV